MFVFAIQMIDQKRPQSRDPITGIHILSKEEYQCDICLQHFLCLLLPRLLRGSVVTNIRVGVPELVKMLAGEVLNRKTGQVASMGPEATVTSLGVVTYHG